MNKLKAFFTDMSPTKTHCMIGVWIVIMSWALVLIPIPSASFIMPILITWGVVGWCGSMWLLSRKRERRTPYL